MKWVTALNLQQWAETIQAKSRLPGIVADLIRGVAKDISDIRFPRDDKGQVRGLDGILEAAGAPPYVPNGKSIWEFGASKDIKTKANSDYEKRTAELDSVVRAEITFVLVTPYTWDKPKEEFSTWLEEKRSRKEWLSVELIDGPKLEDWFRTLLFRSQPDRKTQLHRSVGSLEQLVPVEAPDDEGWLVGRPLRLQDESYAVVCIALDVLEQ